jgi:hypothetical protein
MILIYSRWKSENSYLRYVRLQHNRRHLKRAAPRTGAEHDSRASELGGSSRTRDEELPPSGTDQAACLNFVKVEPAGRGARLRNAPAISKCLT